MPSSAAILAGLTAIANDWWTVAMFWHVYVAGLLFAIVMRTALSSRWLAALLVLPLLSVSALAWTSDNPFNGAVFATLSLMLAAIARGLSSDVITIEPGPSSLVGAVMVVFGWIYPHFLDTTHSTLYLVAAPLGLVPCPTLSAVIGVSLIAGGFRSMAWTSVLAGAGVFYAIVGVVTLNVGIDLLLLGGSVALVVTGIATRRRSPQPLHA